MQFITRLIFFGVCILVVGSLIFIPYAVRSAREPRNRHSEHVGVNLQKRERNSEERIDEFVLQQGRKRAESTKNKKYLSLPDNCLLGSSIPEMVLFISTRPSASDMRAAIRETWGFTAASCGVKIVFGFGRQNSTEIQTLVHIESMIHGDILQDDQIIDSYKNQTAVVLSFFSWSTTYCNSKWVGKADDDTWLNFPLLMSKLRSVQFERYVAGWFFKPGIEVMRDADLSQALSREEYPKDVFPAYASGMMYVFPMVLLPELLKTAALVKQHWIDDVYITGDLVEKLNENCDPDCIHRLDFKGEIAFPDLRYSTECHLVNNTVMHRIDPGLKRLLFYLRCLETIKRC